MDARNGIDWHKSGAVVHVCIYVINSIQLILSI